MTGREPEAEFGATSPADKPTENQGRFDAFTVALVLSGGNALGAYQAGAYQAIHERGIEPDWVAGASVGSINGAIIAGNPRDERIGRLRNWWNPSQHRSSSGAAGPLEELRRTGAALWTMTIGHPGAFLPRNPIASWLEMSGRREASSLYDTTPMVATLERLIDFDLLNAGTTRYSAAAVDLESGDDIVFDTRNMRVGPDHLRASSALLPAFPPVDVAGRLVGDAGISINLPLDGVMSEVGDRPLLCIAIDLLPLRAPRPRTLGETVIRAQDLLFATQSRRALASWQAVFDERIRNDGPSPSATLVHVAYSDPAREVSGKAFDFSPRTTAARWEAGYADLSKALAELASGRLQLARPGLAIYAPGEDGQGLAEMRWSLTPRPA